MILTLMPGKIWWNSVYKIVIKGFKKKAGAEGDDISGAQCYLEPVINKRCNAFNKRLCFYFFDLALIKKILIQLTHGCVRNGLGNRNKIRTIFPDHILR